MAKEIKVINFMKHRHIVSVISELALIAMIVALFVTPLNLGVDFTGGTLIEVGFSESTVASDVRKSLAEMGYDSTSVVNYGSDRDIMIRMQENLKQEDAEKLTAGLQKSADGQITLRRVEVVGPQIGDELTEKGVIAFFLAIAAMMIYVSTRYQYKFAIGAIFALFHDVLFTLGMFALFQWEFDLNVLAAVLAIIGYALNDTMVIFDRIRENFRLERSGTLTEMINLSLTQTLSRTIMTSAVTWFAVIALFFFGGEAIHGFAKAMWIGMVVSVFSTIFTAVNCLFWLDFKREDLIVPVAKDGAYVDDLP